jgi:UDP-N-acetylglucosamine 2-epimerase (non-hydrolysing)
MQKPKIICVVGTRPEAIKMAPIILELQKSKWCFPIVLATSQHNELLYNTLKIFNILPDFNLKIMKKNQNLEDLTSNLIKKVSNFFKKMKPDLVLAQGDTTTVMTTALCCFYEKIPFGHVEAGLRSGDLYNPFPEEFNRIVADKLATLNFAPTNQAKKNLLKEGILKNTIYVTGNTVIDSLFYILKNKNFQNENEVIKKLPKDKKNILVTLHRRESFGKPLKNILLSIKTLAQSHENDLFFIYPVHPNPNVKNTVLNILSNISNILITDPLTYENFVKVMSKSWLVLTDSGGIQEEAPALGKPVFVLRDTTERPEVIKEGLCLLVGRDPERIISSVEWMLSNPEEYNKFAKGYSPYGDGKASKRIVKIIKKFFNL